MTITLHTSRGDLTGNTIPVIVATEWGPDAQVIFSTGDDTRLGMVTERDATQPHAYHVLGTIQSATVDGDVHYRAGAWMEPHSGDPLAGVRQATRQLADTRGLLAADESAWQDTIRAAIVDGQRVVDIAAAAGISRDRVYQIHHRRR